MRFKYCASLVALVFVALLSSVHFSAKAYAQVATSPDTRPSISSSIDAFVTQIANHAMPFATAMAVIGVVTMALIQTLKDVLPVRRWFQCFFVRRWLACAPSFAGTMPDMVRSCEDDLIELTTAGDRDALYDLATEQLCGQINSSAQILIEYPSGHETLLDCLARGADPKDIEKLVSPPESITIERDALSPDEKKEVTAVFDARNRVSHRIQRNIDALQISMSFRWKFILQLVSFGVSFVIAFLGVFQIDRANNFWVGLLIGGMAGFLAPVARDLVAALQQLRKPS